MMNTVYGFVVMASYILGYFMGRASKEDKK